MKKLLFAMPFLLAAFFITGCEEESTTDPVTPTTGGIHIKSTPAGAKIYVDGVLSSKVTPATIDNLTDGKTYTFAIEGAADYDSVKFTYVASKTKTDTVTKVLMQKWYTFTSDTIWESSATGKSGLSLKLGKVISATAAYKDTVDLFYSSAKFRVLSADSSSSLSRPTRFKIGAAGVLTDGVDATVKDNTWLYSFGDRETNYVFAYDTEMHYSKVKIIDFGGGTPGKPAWIKVQWLYRTKVNATDF